MKPEAKELKSTMAKTLNLPKKAIKFTAGGKRLAGAKKKKSSKLGSISGVLDHADS